MLKEMVGGGRWCVFMCVCDCYAWRAIGVVEILVLCWLIVRIYIYIYVDR